MTGVNVGIYELFSSSGSTGSRRGGFWRCGRQHTKIMRRNTVLHIYLMSSRFTTLPETALLLLLVGCKSAVAIDGLLRSSVSAGSGILEDIFSSNLPDSSTKNFIDQVARLQPLTFGLADITYRRLIQCFEKRSKPSLNLFDVSNAAYNGLIEFGVGNGTDADPWAGFQQFAEDDPRTIQFDQGEMVIQEPCNTISNVAYYRALIELCDEKRELSFSPDAITSMAESFSLLAFGSSVWHGSQTQLGNVSDNRAIDIVAFIGYQELVSVLPFDSFIYDLQLSPRNFTGIAAADFISRVFLREPVHLWLENFYRLDLPFYGITFGGLALIVFNLTLPRLLADLVSEAVGGLLLSSSDLDFLLNKVRPIIRSALSSVGASWSDRLRIISATAGTFVKLVRLNLF